jgi:acyl carrier protein
MNDSSKRLIRCFRAVFPELSDAEVMRASTKRTSGWDSLATTNLVAAVEEEFGVEFAASEIERLNSYAAIAERLGKG